MTDITNNLHGFQCTKKDYCPCLDCEEKYVKEKYKPVPTLDLEFERMVGTPKEQWEKRADNITEEYRRHFWELMDSGKNLGEASKLLNLGSNSTMILINRQIKQYSYLVNPYK